MVQLQRNDRGEISSESGVQSSQSESCLTLNSELRTMVKLGNFLFRNRNGIFPLFYLMLFVPSWEVFDNPVTAMIIGFSVTIIGQLIRVITIGLVYIIRGGKDRRVYAEDLVTTGIFAHCRNPLYVGNILILVGLGI